MICGYLTDEKDYPTYLIRFFHIHVHEYIRLDTYMPILSNNLRFFVLLCSKDRVKFNRYNLSIHVSIYSFPFYYYFFHYHFFLIS